MYIGTVAHGRYNRYHYYVCWTAIATAPRPAAPSTASNADELEDAISAAMIEFYTTRQDVIHLPRRFR